MLRFFLCIFAFCGNVLILDFSQAEECYKVFARPPYSNKNALIIGNGSFGTAMSVILSQNFKNVVITSRNKELLSPPDNTSVKDSSFKNRPKNTKIVFLDDKHRDFTLDQTDWDLIVFALPISSLDLILQSHKDFFSSLIDQQIPFVSLTKGVDKHSLKFIDDIFLSYWPASKKNLIVLSGPSFANEIMEKQLTFVTLAGNNKDQLMKVHHMFSTPEMKASLSLDLKGVLIGGAFKNVIAIATGIIEGLTASANTKAGLITLLFNEMREFSYSYEVKTNSFFDFSSLGDTFLSSEGGGSRNKTFGLAIARGQDPEKLIKQQTVEGYHTVLSLYQISKKENKNLPLLKTLYQILYHKAPPESLIDALKEHDSNPVIRYKIGSGLSLKNKELIRNYKVY